MPSRQISTYGNYECTHRNSAVQFFTKFSKSKVFHFSFSLVSVGKLIDRVCKKHKKSNNRYSKNKFSHQITPKKRCPVRAYETTAETNPSIANLEFAFSAFSAYVSSAYCSASVGDTYISGSFANRFCLPLSSVVTVIVVSLRTMSLYRKSKEKSRFPLT